MGEAQERERLRLAIPSLLSVLSGEPPEFDQSRLIGVQSQAKLLHASAKFLEEAFGIGAILESDDKIIGVTNDDQVARGDFGSPLLGPQVKYVVKVHVREQR